MFKNFKIDRCKMCKMCQLCKVLRKSNTDEIMKKVLHVLPFNK